MTVKTTLKEPTLSDKTTYELRVLVQDVPNPIYNVRQRGAASIKTFMRGTVFVVETTFETYGEKVVSIPSIELLASETSILSRPLVLSLIDASEPMQPTTWKEHMASRGFRSLAASINAEMLDRMFQNVDLRPVLLARLAEVMDD